LAVAKRTWVRQKMVKCARVDALVALEAELVFPAEVMPDQPPRVLAHRCSHGMECNSFDRPVCQWAGSLPGFDPLT
jgi:hypothetical protein